MSQISVSEITYSKLNILKTKSILHKKGISFTWDNIIDVLIEVSNKNEEEYLKQISKQNGKRKRKKY